MKGTFSIRLLLISVLSLLPLTACGEAASDGTDADPAVGQENGEAGHDSAAPTDPREVHLTNVRQLTFDGQNAEAYFAFDGSKLVFQRTPREGGCDQIYSMNLDGSEQELVSTGQGRTTCSYY